MLIHCGEPSGAFTEGPGFYPRLTREGDGQTDGEILPARANRRVKK
jgi:hypothetical protein